MNLVETCSYSRFNTGMFIDFHSRYYHPANSYIYLYGDMDMMSTLSFLDEEYLSNFNKIEIDSHIDVQKPFTARKLY